MKKYLINRIFNLSIVLVLIVLALGVFIVIKEQNKNSSNKYNMNIKDFYTYRDFDISDKEHVLNILNNIDFAKRVHLNDVFIYQEDENISMDIHLSKTMNGSEEVNSISYKTLNTASSVIYSVNNKIQNINYYINNEEITISRNWIKNLLQLEPYNSSISKKDYEYFLKILDEKDLNKKPIDYTNIYSSIEDVLQKYKYNELKIDTQKNTEFLGEFSTFAYEIMDVEQGLSYAKAYVYYFERGFEFMNDVFERIYEFETPMMIVFDKIDGEYSYKLLNIPANDFNYDINIQEIFPHQIIEKISQIQTDENIRININDRIEKKALSYLKSINRANSTISGTQKEKEYPPISEKNQQIFEVFQIVFKNYPYYIGDLEKIEDNERYKYLFNHEKNGDKDIIIYKKINMNTNEEIYYLKCELNGMQINELEGKLPNEFTTYLGELKQSLNNN